MTAKKHYLRYFTREDGTACNFRLDAIAKALSKVHSSEVNVVAETCFHVVLNKSKDADDFEKQYFDKLAWLLRKNPFSSTIQKTSTFQSSANVIEIGPRLAFTTAFSTNAVSACRAAGIDCVIRLERSTRYQISSCDGKQLQKEIVLPLIHDRMTECEYTGNICFEKFEKPKQFYEIDLISSIDNLIEANKQLGLAFDDSDIKYYYDLFVFDLQRNPTDVELFDLAQSNSEHSRHTFFKGRLIIDGNERRETLFESICNTQKCSNSNSVIAFSDNSSAIKGFDVYNMVSLSPMTCSELDAFLSKRHIIYSAETHNFPTGVCPFPGAATGVGGRIRDIHATGRGASEIAGVAGYSFGNLHLEGYKLPWEDDFEYPETFAHPRDIIIQASNGASDYGNKFGEPLICGFSRSFGQMLGWNGERCEYVKPIMFSGGIGSIDELQATKRNCERGMLVAKIGGPAYRIGLGGGAASSVHIQGHKDRGADLDFGAVQRGDPEMEQKLHRVIRSCTEYGIANPILSIHDQGAGGNGNVLKELVDNENGGAIIEADKFQLGDPTLSIRELWGSEYQENDAAVIKPTSLATVKAIAKRENCNLSIVGKITGNRKIILLDYGSTSLKNTPVNLDLDSLKKRPPKEFYLTSVKETVPSLEIPKNLSVMDALSLVLRLPSVASKRFLTNKVDRSVTGLIAQQQCVGPLGTPLSDVAVVALSYWDTVGGAVALGEQPIKGIASPKAGARMSLAEALTNLVFAPITTRKDIKCSGNWMWPAKLQGEGARLVEACDALCRAMGQLGIAVDGGKDSLSMAAQVGSKIVKAPGTIVISAYAPCTDITQVVTPDLKGSQVGTPSRLIYVRFGNTGESHRLGGTALAQCLKQVGRPVCDIEDFASFAIAFDIVQDLVKKDRLLSGHDVSDGGLLTCALEMAFAGNRSIVLHICSKFGALETLFSEESGVILEVEERQVDDVIATFQNNGILAQCIGFTTPDVGKNSLVVVNFNGETVLSVPLGQLRKIWEETSHHLELMQTSVKCAEQQMEWLSDAENVEYIANFDYSMHRIDFTAQRLFKLYAVGIIREEGSNGDREMAAAFHMAGFTPYDIMMTDLLEGDVHLDNFSGIAFVGGFSYADVLGSAKGWASSIMFHEKVLAEFERFRRRDDTFSLGVCNGCQLMALLGWIGTAGEEKSDDVFLQENDCGRLQCSFSTVVIPESPSILLKGMSGSVLGVWSSHGEGKFVYRSDQVLDTLESKNLVALRYCDGGGKPTMRFPENPNGSDRSVAALCSEDGRHLAMMPHPDRSFLSWQWPNYPRQWHSARNHNSPWMRMFTNAYSFAYEMGR